jgi:hypothetical protein
MSQDQESPGFNVTIPLSRVAVEVLHCLFIHGPTYDGDVPSKSGRDELVTLGLAARAEGYQFLTGHGVRLAIANGIHRKKEVDRRNERKRLALVDHIESLFSPRDGESMGLKEKEIRRPTIAQVEEVINRTRAAGDETTYPRIDAP